MKKFLGIVLAAMGIVIIALSVVFKMNGHLPASSIGGPDGPTVIIKAAEFGNISLIIGIIAGIALFAAGAFMTVRTVRKNK